MGGRKVVFPKVNGRVINGKRLEVRVGGVKVYGPFVQTNIVEEGKSPTHYRIINKKIGDDSKAYPIKDPRKYLEEAANVVKEIMKENFSGAKIEINYKEKEKQTNNHYSGWWFATGMQ